MATIILTTSRPGVTLRGLTRSDAPALFALIQANRSHLTAHGDYADQVAARVEDIATELAMEPTRHKRFGILSAGQLVGRVDLIGAEPPWLLAGCVACRQGHRHSGSGIDR